MLADERKEQKEFELATRQGKKAFWDGVPLEANPMQSFDSRVAWEDAWKREQAWKGEQDFWEQRRAQSEKVAEAAAEY